MIELGVAHNIIEKSGAWYAYRGEKIGQGKDNTRDYLKEHPELAVEIEAKIRAAVGVPLPGPARSAPAAEE
jgi:recombination protein RecA